MCMHKHIYMWEICVFYIYFQQQIESLRKGICKTLVSQTSQCFVLTDIHGNDNCSIFSSLHWLFPVHLLHLMLCM